MGIKNQTSVYGIIGNPVAHSISPFIHNFAFNFYKINSFYQAFDVIGENLERAVDAIRVMSIRGCNITIPHKKNIIPFLDKISPVAQKLNSVNTVKNENGVLTGFCTDYYGFTKKFIINNIDYKNANFLVIGSGGSATAIIRGLLLVDNIKSVSIAARNKEAANIIKSEILDESPDKNIEILDNLSTELKNKIHRFDIIVQTTPLGMKGNLDKTPIDSSVFKSNQIVYDIIYTPLKTKFLKEAENKGCKIYNGLDMLLYQAEKSFNIWTQKEFPTEIIKQEVFNTGVIDG